MVIGTLTLTKKSFPWSMNGKDESESSRLIPHPQISPSPRFFSQRIKNGRREILIEFEKANDKSKAIKQKDLQIKVLMLQPVHKLLKLP